MCSRKKTLDRLMDFNKWLGWPFWGSWNLWRLVLWFALSRRGLLKKEGIYKYKDILILNDTVRVLLAQKMPTVATPSLRRLFPLRLLYYFQLNLSEEMGKRNSLWCTISRFHLQPPMELILAPYSGRMW